MIYKDNRFINGFYNNSLRFKNHNDEFAPIEKGHSFPNGNRAGNYCRCKNQQDVTFEDICDNCMLLIKRDNE